MAVLTFSLLSNSDAASNNFDSFLKPLFEKNCNQCHGKKKTKGKVNLYELTTFEKFISKPEIIKEVIEAIDANDMPPEDEPQLTKPQKTKLIASLKSLLQQSAKNHKIKDVVFKRLNRFQYNNTVKDLFKMKRDAFHLPEKLMTRRTNYLIDNNAKMPNSVDVYNASLKRIAVLRGVDKFPQDLRATHGFDNQADQLTMAPILLDSYLKLSISIVNSPDFSARNIGIWKEFFQEPNTKSKIDIEIKKRLKPFLTRAFRMPIDEATVERYTYYAMAKIKGGLSFTEAMKKVASVTLASPLFLHSFNSIDPRKKDFNLASKLSYFLWGSAPDQTLLSLAAQGTLSQKGNLDSSIDRMLKDPKIERFLDSFPSQWMQLEALFSAQPDPKLYRKYSLDKKRPVSAHMVLEPLLLFDTVFIENRPLMELIKPSFSKKKRLPQKMVFLER